MGTRADFHTFLKAILGTAFVYFDPPHGHQMSYPAIVYNRDDIHMNHADNIVYRNKVRYLVTYIDRNPDSTITNVLAMLPLCSYDRHFTSDGLHHDVFNIYF